MYTPLILKNTIELVHSVHFEDRIMKWWICALKISLWPLWNWKKRDETARKRALPVTKWNLLGLGEETDRGEGEWTGCMYFRGRKTFRIFIIYVTICFIKSFFESKEFSHVAHNAGCFLFPSIPGAKIFLAYSSGRNIQEILWWVMVF